MRIVIEFLVSFVLLASATTSYADDNLLALLQAQKYPELEQVMARTQADFEAGTISEIQLRNTYRPFYSLNNDLVKNVEAWTSAFPTSYSAHLVYGIWYKRRAAEARGEGYIQNTPPDGLQKMSQLNAIAKSELQKSLMLTRKPYLSVFHLLTISLLEGTKGEAAKFLNAGNKMLPSNTLLRNRYMVTLEPRWGGSYAEMQKFIDRSKSEGASQEGVLQLSAIVQEDMGHSLMERGMTEEAITHFRQALDLAAKVRREFRSEFLENSNYYSCQFSELKSYCVTAKS
jgi:hypothetical protein